MATEPAKRRTRSSSTTAETASALLSSRSANRVPGPGMVVGNVVLPPGWDIPAPVDGPRWFGGSMSLLLGRIDLGASLAESAPSGTARTSDRMLTASEAAKLLGVSKWTLYAAANRHEVPHRRLGRRMLFSRRALMLWLQGASPRSAGMEDDDAGLP